MQKTFKLGFLGRFIVMYFAVVLILSVLSPVLQIEKSEAASTQVAQLDESRAVTGPIDYSVADTFPSNILGVKAVYYDYLSDEEHNGSWLNPMQAGTGHNGSSDDWYPFYIFNEKLSTYAKNNSSWDTPLYFGNFCNTSDAYPNGTDHDSWGWSHVTGDQYGYKFNYYANNSSGLPNYNVSYQGLVNSSLVDNKLYVNSTVAAPYFDNDWLKTNGLAKIIEGEFPFVIDEESGYKKYSFNSKNAEDNVYFTWATENGVTYPTKVNYGSGSGFGVQDGIQYFMYQQSSGYGIFPFNNASSTNKGTKTYANENLNYGYGVRMDIDFRVPEGGVIPGTSTPIQFEFTGDDDLWVYITDNETGQSQLILDMGGAHKESHGVIDFKDEVATVDAVYAEGMSSSDVITIEDYSNWGSDVRIWAWNDGENGEWYYSSQNGNVHTFSKSLVGSNGNTLSSKTKFHFVKGNWEVQSAEYLLANYWGKRTYTDNMSYTDTPGSVNGTTSVETSFADFFDNSSDQKTYTMSVFYMERGLIESNMSISFTMTPLDSDLSVTKNINTASVNSGIVDELVENEEFTYTVYNDPDTDSTTSNYALATNKSYSHTTQGGSTSTDGKFPLKDDETARFDAQFAVNTGMKIVENTTSEAGLSYTASWKLKDNISSSQISSGSSETSAFTLINSSNNVDAKTSLLLEYTNTPKVSNLWVTKEVVDDSNNNISSSTDTEFTYNIALDLYEGNTYNDSLDLSYSLRENNTVVGNYTATDGTFTLSAGQTAVFAGIPVGTKYKITEQVQDGYTLSSATINGTTTAVSGNTVSGSKRTSTDTVVITNMYSPASTALKAYKTLDGELYSGSDFTFKVTGLASKTVGGFTTKDTSSVSVTSSTASDGVVTFANTTDNAPFTYDAAGTYCYKIEEVAHQSTDYIFDSSVFYAKVVVTANASTGALTVSTPTYYTDANFSTQVVAANVLFANESATCEVRVIKKNFNKTETLQGGEFKLVSALEDMYGNWIENQDADFVPVTAVVSDHDGSYYAEFTDVPQGDYLIIETKAPEGYEISDTPVYVAVKRTTDNEGVVTVNFSDMSSTFLPKAGGIGVTIFAIIGIVCLVMSFVFLTVKSTREKKAYSARHYR